MNKVQLIEGIVPPQARPNGQQRKSKYDFLKQITFGNYAFLGKFHSQSKEYNRVANQVWSFNKKNGRKLAVRTTTNGVIVYRRA